MKQCRIFPLIILLAFLAGCAAPTPLPQTSIPVPPTDTPAPTDTPLPPTITSTPTATPYPPLSTDGPYFAYLKGAPKEQRAIVFLDANGVGRKEVLLPDNISQQMYDLNNLSPDGKWLAYYTGEPYVYLVYKSFGIPSEGPYDLALNLYNLETKESKLITPLLSEDFPNNFQKQMDIFKKTDTPRELQNPSEEYNLSTIYSTFLIGIDSLSWSPDGRYLAFAGQMNGLSSDLYVYDMEAQTIRQLSSGPEEIFWISWPPNGKGILHASTYEVGMGMECRTYIADLDGISVRYLSKNKPCNPPRDWINDFNYLEYDNENVTGNYFLRSVDIRTGGIFTYWDRTFTSFDLDRERGLIALGSQMVDRFYPDAPKQGLYLITIGNDKETGISEGMWLTEFFGIGKRRFVAYKAGKGGYKPCCFLNDDATLTPIEGDYSNILVSPNRQYWVGIGKTISFFSADDILVHDVAMPSNLGERNNFELTSWSPDSSGFYFLCWQSEFDGEEYRRLFYINILNGDLLLIDDSVSPIFGYTWISP